MNIVILCNVLYCTINKICREVMLFCTEGKRWATLFSTTGSSLRPDIQEGATFVIPWPATWKYIFGLKRTSRVDWKSAGLSVHLCIWDARGDAHLSFSGSFLNIRQNWGLKVDSHDGLYDYECLRNCEIIPHQHSLQIALHFYIIAVTLYSIRQEQPKWLYICPFYQ